MAEKLFRGNKRLAFPRNGNLIVDIVRWDRNPHVPCGTHQTTTLLLINKSRAFMMIRVFDRQCSFGKTGFIEPGEHMTVNVVSHDEDFIGIFSFEESMKSIKAVKLNMIELFDPETSGPHEASNNDELSTFNRYALCKMLGNSWSSFKNMNVEEARWEERGRKERARELQRLAEQQGPPQDGQGRDGQGRDGQGRDGQVQDGQGRDGQVQDGQVQYGQGRDGQVQYGQGWDGQVQDGQVQDGQGRDGQVQDGQVQYGQGWDGQVQDGQGWDGQVQDGQVQDGQVQDGQVQYGQGWDGQVQEGQGQDGQARYGQARVGQARYGQARDGQARDGQGRDGQRRDGNAALERNEPTPDYPQDSTEATALLTAADRDEAGNGGHVRPGQVSKIMAAYRYARQWLTSSVRLQRMA